VENYKFRNIPKYQASIKNCTPESYWKAQFQPNLARFHNYFYSLWKSLILFGLLLKANYPKIFSISLSDLSNTLATRKISYSGISGTPLTVPSVYSLGPFSMLLPAANLISMRTASHGDMTLRWTSSPHHCNVWITVLFMLPSHNIFPLLLSLVYVLTCSSQRPILFMLWNWMWALKQV